MSYQNRLDQILNKGIAIDVKEESKPKTADDRYLKINTLPDNNAKIEVDDTVSYLLKPLSFSDGINYIPIENLKGIFNGKVLIKQSVQTLLNYASNEKLQKNSKYIFDNFKHDIFTCATAQSDTLITVPTKLYNNLTFKLQDKNLNIQIENTYLMRVYVIEDPYHPENNGTVKLLVAKSSFFEKLIEIQKNYNENKTFSEKNKFEKLQKDTTKDNSAEIESLLTTIASKTIDLFDANTNVFVKMNINVQENQSQNKTLYTDLTIIENDLGNVTIDNTNSAKDLFIEFKNKYIGGVCIDTKYQKSFIEPNLTNLGWSLDNIFEYKAYFDLYNYVKNEPHKLNLFNQFNKYNFDTSLFTEENYKPKKPLIKNNKEFDVEPENDVEQHFKDTTPSKPREIPQIEDIDDMENIPF
jgi:hypothetical protein